MKLSVVILNYNVRYFLELCLRSVSAAIEDIEAEIIVVDNNSTDDSCKMVKQLFPSVILLANKENLGFSKGNNIGVKEAKGEYICILNPDTVVAEDTFTKLLDYAKLKNDLGILGCRLIDGKGKFLPESKRNIPKPFVALKKMRGNASSYYANQLKETASGKVDILVGAFMMVKRSIYNAVGGFDEDYFMYGEDIDISYKMKKQGYQNYYQGDVVCIHYKGESTLRDIHYAKRFYGAMQIFYKKHFKRNFLFNGLVWVGIKLAYLTRSTGKKVTNTVKHHIIYSDEMYEGLNTKLSHVAYTNHLDHIENKSCVVFDQNIHSYQSIIGMMLSLANKGDFTYRILPKNTNFIIGSDSAIERGEVITF